MWSVVINLAAAFCAVSAVLAHARRSRFSVLLRYFTVQSNLFCAAASVAVALMRLLGAQWAWAPVLKYMGTVAVTLTLLTVVLFLSRLYGFKALLAGPDLWLHLICPLMALLSYLAWDRNLGPAAPVVMGLLPVILYGLLYLYKVIFKKAWKDFYGFNRDGKWPVSFLAMFAAAAFLSWALSAL